MMKSVLVLYIVERGNARDEDESTQIEIEEKIVLLFYYFATALCAYF